MRRGYLLVVLLVALAVALWLPPAQRFLRDSLVVPLLEVFWFARLAFESIPQSFVWGFLVLLALLVAGRSLSPRSRYAAAPQRQAAAQGSLLAPWARLIFQSSRDDYARWRLAQRLAQLAQGALGVGEPLSPSELRRYLASEPPEVPPEVRAYLLAGLATYTPERRALPAFGLLGLAGVGRGSGPLALDPAEVVAFLEAAGARKG